MQIYEIKINRNKWEKVKASGIKALSDYCKKNNIPDWRMVGMQSISEMKENKNLREVA